MGGYQRPPAPVRIVPENDAPVRPFRSPDRYRRPPRIRIVGITRPEPANAALRPRRENRGKGRNHAVSVVSVALFPAVHAGDRAVAGPVVRADRAGARHALPPRQPADPAGGPGRLRHGAVLHRPAVPHAVPDARRPGRLLRHPPPVAAARPAALHRRHPHGRGERGHADTDEHRVLPALGLHHPPRVPLAHARRAAVRVRRVAGGGDAAADRGFRHLPVRLPVLRRRRPAREYAGRRARIRCGHARRPPVPAARGRHGHDRQPGIRPPLRRLRDRHGADRARRRPGRHAGLGRLHGHRLRLARRLAHMGARRRLDDRRPDHAGLARRIRMGDPVAARRAHARRQLHAHDLRDQGTRRMAPHGSTPPGSPCWR